MAGKIQAVKAFLSATKIGKVTSAVGKKLSTTPQEFMNRAVREAINTSGEGAIARRAAKIRDLNILYGQKIGLNKAKTKITKYPSFSKIKNKSIREDLLAESLNERTLGKDMLRQYFNPGTENPALRGLGEGLETIAPESLNATKYRRWGAAGATAWIGSNFLRRGDQIGPF